VKNGLLAAYPTTENECTVGMNRYSRDTTAKASKLEIGMRTHPLPLRLYWASKQSNAKESFVADRWLLQLYPCTRAYRMYIFLSATRHHSPSDNVSSSSRFPFTTVDKSSHHAIKFFYQYHSIYFSFIKL